MARRLACGRVFLWGLLERSPHTPKNFEWPAGLPAGGFFVGGFLKEAPTPPRTSNGPQTCLRAGFYCGECNAERFARAYIRRPMIPAPSIRPPKTLLFPRQTAFGAKPPHGTEPGQGEWGAARSLGVPDGSRPLPGDGQTSLPAARSANTAHNPLGDALHVQRKKSPAGVACGPFKVLEGVWGNFF